MKRTTIDKAAAALGMTPRRLRILCAEGRVRGAIRTGGKFRATWSIPVGADGLPILRPAPVTNSGKRRGPPLGTKPQTGDRTA